MDVGLRLSTLLYVPARSNGYRDLLVTHGNVDGAQEENQLGGAPVLHQRREGLKREVGVSLGVVTHQVGRAGVVVARGSAEVHGDALARGDRGRAPRRGQHRPCPQRPHHCQPPPARTVSAEAVKEVEGGGGSVNLLNNVGRD